MAALRIKSLIHAKNTIPRMLTLFHCYLFMWSSKCIQFIFKTQSMRINEHFEIYSYSILWYFFFPKNKSMNTLKEKLGVVREI